MPRPLTITTNTCTSMMYPPYIVHTYWPPALSRAGLAWDGGLNLALPPSRIQLDSMEERSPSVGSLDLVRPCIGDAESEDDVGKSKYLHTYILTRARSPIQSIVPTYRYTLHTRTTHAHAHAHTRTHAPHTHHTYIHTYILSTDTHATWRANGYLTWAFWPTSGGERSFSVQRSQLHT